MACQISTFKYRRHWRPCVTFRNNLVFNGQELLDPCPTPTLDSHPLSAIRDCSFNIIVYLKVVSIRNPKTCNAVVTGTHINNVGKSEKRDHSEDLGVDGRIILELILWKWGGNVRTGCIWLRTGTSSGLL
jgi:hypothetical protein